MNCVIIEGDRGLYTCINGKYYFPDRSFKEACVGFCRGIKVTKDNGMYGFFTGTMLRDIKCSDWDDCFEEAGCSGFGLSRLVLGGCDALIKLGRSSRVFVGGKFFCDIDSQSFISSLIGYLSEKTAEGLRRYDNASGLVAKWMKSAPATRAVKMWQAKCWVYGMCGLNTSRSMTVWNDRVYALKEGSRVVRVGWFDAEDDDSIFHESGVAAILSVLSDKPDEGINAADINSYWIENYLSCRYLNGNIGKDTISYRFQLGGNEYSLEMFKCLCRRDIENAEKHILAKDEVYQSVKASVEGIESWVKYCAKGLTAKNASMLGDVLKDIRTTTRLRVL